MGTSRISFFKSSPEASRPHQTPGFESSSGRHSVGAKGYWSLFGKNPYDFPERRRRFVMSFPIRYVMSGGGATAPAGILRCSGDRE